jgi:hypothetical protein
MVFWSRQDAVRANKQGPHWRHLHQQGSAACSIFLQGLPGRVPLAALCSAALLGSSWLLLTLTGMLAGVGKGAPGALCVALSQIRPLQHHPVRMPNLHREQLRNLQRALVIVPGVGGESLLADDSLHPGPSCNGTRFTGCCSAFQGVILITRPK